MWWKFYRCEVTKLFPAFIFLAIRLEIMSSYLHSSGIILDGVAVVVVDVVLGRFVAPTGREVGLLLRLAARV